MERDGSDSSLSSPAASDSKQSIFCSDTFHSSTKSTTVNATQEMYFHLIEMLNEDNWWVDCLMLA